MTQEQQSLSQHRLLFWLVSKRCTLLIVALLTALSAIIILLRQGSLLTPYTFFLLVEVAPTFLACRLIQDDLQTVLIRSYGARTLGTVLRMKTQPKSHGGRDHGALVEYATERGVKQQWFSYNHMPARRIVTVLSHPYAPDQIMLDKTVSQYEPFFFTVEIVFSTLFLFGLILWSCWFLLTGPFG